METTLTDECSAHELILFFFPVYRMQDHQLTVNLGGRG